ncbi:hypothetical protein EON65_44995 [archaeon]|nr:MAG: hypothetical protein EON65_44995 [archaeon]
MLRSTRRFCRGPTNASFINLSWCRYLGAASSADKNGYLLQNDEVRDVVDRLNTETRVRDNGYMEVKICGLCPKGNKDKIDNLWKLNIRPDGSYYCYRCAVGGSFQDLKLKVNKHSSESFTSSQGHQQQEIPEIEPENKKSKSVYPHQSLMHKYHTNLFPTHPDKHPQPDHFQAAKEYLNKVRGLDDAVLKKYQVGFTIQQFLSDEGEWVDHVCITFPTICRVEEVGEVKSLNFQVVDKNSAANGKKPIKIGDEEFLIQKVKYR